LNAVIPGRAREPGIQTHRERIWIPDNRRAVSGMTEKAKPRLTLDSDRIIFFSVSIHEGRF
jgi:hypothetical protein